MSHPAAPGSAGALASSRLQQHLQQFITHHSIEGHLLIALSGGLDSCVLLHLFAAFHNSPGIRLSAMHVHHGLSPHADQWAEHCRRLCASHAIPLQVVRVHVPCDSGQGLEAAARHLRYEALRGAQADYVVLAHHQDDQAETVMLQLLRGAGMRGLAAMASHDAQQRLLRPLLDISRAQLAAYAAEHQLGWVEDESNHDTHYDRNFCRQQVLPMLEQRFPGARKALARSALHAAEAESLQMALAELDAAEALRGDALNVASLQALGEVRARNLLRWWLSSRLRYLPHREHLQEMLRQLLTAADDAKLALLLDGELGLWLRRYRGYAHVVVDLKTATMDIAWDQQPVVALPDGSQLYFEQRRGVGLALDRLSGKTLRIRHRQGGEHFKPHANRPGRSLKHWLQDAAMPPWQREQLPLVFGDDELIWVPGIGMASHLQAEAHEDGLVIRWSGNPWMDSN
ncbi:tRNA lysidine(34) synthetase TilS [Methylovorus menthalis]|uniref:tRNA lysidine(34) synthetase TilS n=1 Tax=Methylovorus menthalis TaxID=1002227 RepID=UPI001E4824AC|nr:tRNA lysidine(34) synthetase TilS [Methylovorus menthalis]MCB4811429.1 tRNA lysidine(34) synthetase TilS [Methylovorus menthalis]